MGLGGAVVGVGAWLVQVTQVLKVEVSSSIRPWFPPKALSTPKTNFDCNVRQYTGTEKGEIRLWN